MTDRPDCPAGPATIELRLPHDPAAVAAARHCVADLVTYAADELVDRATLVVSELATNAVRHTDAAFTIRVSCLDAHLLIEVDDVGAGVPQRVEADELDQTGRGIGLVEALADRCGIAFHEPGKTVWADFDTVGSNGHRPQP